MSRILWYNCSGGTGNLNNTTLSWWWLSVFLSLVYKWDKVFLYVRRNYGLASFLKNWSLKKHKLYLSLCWEMMKRKDSHYLKLGNLWSIINDPGNFSSWIAIKENWKKNLRFQYPSCSFPEFIIPYQVLLVQSGGIYVGVHHFQWRPAAFVLSWEPLAFPFFSVWLPTFLGHKIYNNKMQNL